MQYLSLAANEKCHPLSRLAGRTDLLRLLVDEVARVEGGGDTPTFVAYEREGKVVLDRKLVVVLDGIRAAADHLEPQLAKVLHGFLEVLALPRSSAGSRFGIEPQNEPIFAVVSQHQVRDTLPGVVHAEDRRREGRCVLSCCLMLRRLLPLLPLDRGTE